MGRRDHPALASVTGQEMPKTDQPKYELKGQAFDEDTVEQQYPVLAKKFGDE